MGVKYGTSFDGEKHGDPLFLPMSLSFIMLIYFLIKFYCIMKKVEYILLFYEVFTELMIPPAAKWDFLNWQHIAAGGFWWYAYRRWNLYILIIGSIFW